MNIAGTKRIYARLDDAGLSSLSEVEQGVQHVLADIMAKDFDIINATRQRCVFYHSQFPQVLP